MSYESQIRGADGYGADPRPEAVLFHRGAAAAPLRRHHKDATRASREGLRGVKSLAPHLLARVADARVLRRAWDDLGRRGGPAPGPNRLRHADLSSSEAWDLCRCLGQAVRAGTYRPGRERVCWIPKGPGRGERPLVLQNIEDRVVQRALLLILQPLLDPLFDGRSFGFRPGRGQLHALALAEHLVLSEGRRAWMTEDVRDAFRHVPLARLLQVVRAYLPADDLLGLIGAVLSGGTMPGLRQGGPLSPLLLNLYLHHVLDRPWRRAEPELPLVRWADDLLVLGRTEDEAERAHAGLHALVLPAGLPLKGTATAVRLLDRGDRAEWLGFSLAAPRRGLAIGLAIGLGEDSWDRLDGALALAHTRCDAPLHAIAILEGWISQRGPCYRRSDRAAVVDRLLAAARAQAFDEVPGPVALQASWRRASARWCRFRRAQSAQAPPRDEADRPDLGGRVGAPFEDAITPDPSRTGPPALTPAGDVRTSATAGC